MGLFQRIGAARDALFGAPRAANELREYANIEEALKSFARQNVSAAGVDVTVTSAQRVAAVYACVRVLRETISHLPLVLYRTDGKVRLPDTGNPLYSLLKDQPNEWQTSMEFRELMQVDLELRGNAYAMKVMSGGRVLELIRLHPDLVEVDQGHDFRLTYTFTKADGKRVRYDQGDIFHVRGAGSDGIKGESPIAIHRETIGDAIAMQRHGSKIFSNGARLGGILEQEAGTKIGEEARKELRTDFESLHTGVENAHRTAILPGGISYKPVAMSMVDSEYIQGRKFTRSEIFSIYGVPPHKGGDLEHATFSNIEHQALEFVQDAIVPRCVRFEQAIKRDLIGNDPTRYAKHTIDGLLRGDAKSRAEALQIKRRNGVISADEWRELDDMNPRGDAGGVGYIVEQNMRPDDGSNPMGRTNEPQ